MGAAVVPAGIPGGIASLKKGLSLSRAGSQRSLKGSSLSLIVSSPSQQSQQAGGSSPVFAELACIPMEANSPVLREANQPRAMDQGVSRRYLGFSQVDEDAPEEVVKAAGAEGRAMDAVKAAAVPTEAAASSKGRAAQSRFKKKAKQVAQMMAS